MNEAVACSYSSFIAESRSSVPYPTSVPFPSDRLFVLRAGCIEEDQSVGLATSKMHKRTSTKVAPMCFHPDRPVGAVGIGTNSCPSPGFHRIVQ